MLNYRTVNAALDTAWSLHESAGLCMSLFHLSETCNKQQETDMDPSKTDQLISNMVNDIQNALNDIQKTENHIKRLESDLTTNKILLTAQRSAHDTLALRLTELTDTFKG